MSMDEAVSNGVTPLAYVDGWPIHLANAAKSLRAITEAAVRGDFFSVFPLNLDLSLSCEATRRCVTRCRKRLTSSPGAGPLLFSPDHNRAFVERTTGADLVVPIVHEAARLRLPVRGHRSHCRVRSPKICLLALGAPKEEIFAVRAIDRGVKAGFIAVGAGLDFIVGAQTRAPSFMRDHGLEWLWRLLTNPRRLGWRYAQCAAVLIDLVLFSPIRRGFHFTATR